MLRSRYTINVMLFAGNIVVDGVAASVYNTAIGTEARMHTFMVLGRVLWRRAPWLLHAMHRARLAQPLSLAIGRAFAAVCPCRCKSASPGCCARLDGHLHAHLQTALAGELWRHA